MSLFFAAVLLSGLEDPFQSKYACKRLIDAYIAGRDHSLVQIAWLEGQQAHKKFDDATELARAALMSDPANIARNAELMVKACQADS